MLHEYIVTYVSYMFGWCGHFNLYIHFSTHCRMPKNHAIFMLLHKVICTYTLYTTALLQHESQHCLSNTLKQSKQFRLISRANNNILCKMGVSTV